MTTVVQTEVTQVLVEGGPRGFSGWTPRFALVPDDGAYVLEIVGWSGGSGPAPVTGYLTADGTLTSDIAEATHFGGGAFALSDGPPRPPASGQAPVAYTDTNDGRKKFINSDGSIEGVLTEILSP